MGSGVIIDGVQQAYVAPYNGYQHHNIVLPISKGSVVQVISDMGQGNSQIGCYFIPPRNDKGGIAVNAYITY
jgi:hypothetical protein